MDIFRRRKKIPPPPEPPEGNANLAKQVSTATVTATHRATPLSVQTALDPEPPTEQHLRARLSTESESEVVYEFDTTLSIHGKRSTRWYVTWAIAFAVFVGINVWLKLYLSAVVILLAATLIFVNAAQKPKTIRVQITKAGIKLGKQLIAWREIEKFWILFEPPQLNRLFLKRRTRMLTEVSIELGSEDPLKIRDLLLAWVPEDPTREESRVDFVGRILKL